MSIPFNRPGVVGTELTYIAEAFAAGQISGDGVFTRRCHALLQEILGAPKVLLTTSCTSALDMSALLLDVGPGDEVIVPSYTFPSTVNAFVLRGARPIFADIRRDTLNLDEALLPSLVTSRTKAMIPVHYAGVGCEMDAIGAIARNAGAAVVEDNAHGLFGRYRGRPLGSFGALATLSFHETKNVSCGEGGALLVNDPSLIARAEIIREKGTDRAAFFRGATDKYTWVDIGSSYLPSDILAAFLWAQLDAAEQIQQRRLGIWQRYAAHLASWASAHGVTLPHVPAHCEHPAHLFYMLMPSLEDRDGLISHLRQLGITSVFHYVPLHASPMGQRWASPGACPVTERISSCLVRLPFYTELDSDVQDAVIDAVMAYRPSQSIECPAT